MNLIFANDAEEYIILLINSVSESEFNNFIKKIDEKSDWIEELCCCYFETSCGNEEYYRFETFEGNTYKLSYEKFLDYVKLAIIRYFLGCKSNEKKILLKEVIKNTVFRYTLDKIDPSLSTGYPLIWGSN